MTAINGTNVAAGIAPFTTEDTFATHYARYGQGGLHSVETIAERDAISEFRLEVGMLVYVAEEDKTYQLKTFDEETQEKTWEEFVGGAGTTDYNDLTNKPAIDGVVLTSSTTKSDLGLADLYKIKGSVETFEDLEDIENPQNGDAYRVIDEGKVYAWDGTEWFDIGGESSGLDTLGLIVPDTKDLQAIDEVEFDMSSSSAYYSFLKYNGTLSSLRDINGSALFRITITGENVNTTIEGVVNMRQRAAEAPYVVVRNKPGTKTAANTGARYLRLIYPKSITSDADWGFELRAYNAKARHVKVELLKADQGFELVDGTLSTYSSSVQSYTSMTLYTTDGLIGSGTLSWNTVSSDKAGYITSYLPKFVSGGTMPLCGEAVPAYSLCFMSEGKIYTSSQSLAAIDPDFGVQVCMVSTKVNAAIAYTSLRQKEAVTKLTQIPHDTLARGNPCFLRCKLEDGKIFSDNYVTTSMAPGYTWYYLGVAASTKAINIDTTQSVFISLNGDGELERINGKPLDAYTKDEIDEKIELLEASSDVRDIVGSYQDLLNYPTEELLNGDVIEVLEDAEHDGTATYYRWVMDTEYPAGHWVYVGERGPYYTKHQTDNLIRDAVANEALIRQAQDNEIRDLVDGCAKYGIQKEYPFNIPQPSVENEGVLLFVHQPDINYLGELPEMPTDSQPKDAWIYNNNYYVKTESGLYQEAVVEDTLRFDGLYDLYISNETVLMTAYKTSSGYMPYGNQYVYLVAGNKYINFIYPDSEEPRRSQSYVYGEHEGIITKIACAEAGYGYINADDEVCYWTDAVENMTTGPIVDGDLICDQYHNPIYLYDEEEDAYYTLPIVSVDVESGEITDSDGNIYRRAPQHDKIYYGFSDGSNTVFFFGNPDSEGFEPEDVYIEDEQNELVLSDLTVENYDSVTKTATLSDGADYVYNHEVRAFDVFDCQMLHVKNQDLAEYHWKPLSNYRGTGEEIESITNAEIDEMWSD